MLVDRSSIDSILSSVPSVGFPDLIPIVGDRGAFSRFASTTEVPDRGAFPSFPSTIEVPDGGTLTIEVLSLIHI